MPLPEPIKKEQLLQLLGTTDLKVDYCINQLRKTGVILETEWLDLKDVRPTSERINQLVNLMQGKSGEMANKLVEIIDGDGKVSECTAGALSPDTATYLPLFYRTQPQIARRIREHVVSEVSKAAATASFSPPHQPPMSGHAPVKEIIVEAEGDDHAVMVVDTVIGGDGSGANQERATKTKLKGGKGAKMVIGSKIASTNLLDE